MRFLGISHGLFFLLPKNRPLHRKTDCNSAMTASPRTPRQPFRLHSLPNSLPRDARQPPRKARSPALSPGRSPAPSQSSLLSPLARPLAFTHSPARSPGTLARDARPLPGTPAIAYRRPHCSFLIAHYSFVPLALSPGCSPAPSLSLPSPLTRTTRQPPAPSLTPQLARPVHSQPTIGGPRANSSLLTTHSSPQPYRRDTRNPQLPAKSPTYPFSFPCLTVNHKAFSTAILSWPPN
jgi:hypothetical protein